MSGKLSFNKSSSQDWRTFLVSKDFYIHFIQVLSIPANCLAWRGICLAISPPVNTGSKLVQSFCTLIQRSRVYDVSENLRINYSTLFLKGTTCLWALIELSVIWSSSNLYAISWTQRPAKIAFSLLPQGPKSNSLDYQNSSISANAISIFFCF